VFTPEEAKQLVDRIRLEIEASRGTWIWEDYVNALNLISQVVFFRSSGFILEFLQNAEDSGLGLATPGEFAVYLNKHRAKVLHNGRPFSDANLTALCGIRSSKKPEQGTLGYLGIGFKSVYRVTDKPEIYSNGLQFKFERDHWQEPNKTPWHVLPLPLDSSSESVNPAQTTFIVPFRKDEATRMYDSLWTELQKLSTQVYLFLRWIKRITIANEETGATRTLECLSSEADGTIMLRGDGKEQRFRMFRRTIKVADAPEEVRQDRLTQQYRANVAERQIAVAFALDSGGNLAPYQAGAMFGGVYSFVPLSESNSGAKFPIQADFLVQPGREATNYEARWNEWLVDESFKLCKEAIATFKAHSLWRYQLLPVFESTDKSSEAYKRLFGPRLMEPLEQYLKDDGSAATADGGFAKPHNAFRLKEDPKALNNLLGLGILTENELGLAFGVGSDARPVHQQTLGNFKEVDRLDLLRNSEFLMAKANQPDAAKWFRSLYLWIDSHPRWHQTKGRPQEGYWGHPFVLTTNGKPLEGRSVLLPDSQFPSDLLTTLSASILKDKPVLHPDVIGGAASQEEQTRLRGFLTGLTGMQILDAEKVVDQGLVPKLLTRAPKPALTDLISWTRYCHQFLGSELGLQTGQELWVCTKKNEIRPAKEVLFSQEFNPPSNWEHNAQYLSSLNFLTPEYLQGSSDPSELANWHDFFKAAGVRENPDGGVEEFAINFTKAKLGTKYDSIERVDKQNYGYDLQAKTSASAIHHIEVKGLSRDQQVELTENETKAANIHKDSFDLCIVTDIPNNPKLYRIPNPSVVGNKNKVFFPEELWKKYPSP
jgi:hypothetical protein